MVTLAAGSSPGAHVADVHDSAGPPTGERLPRVPAYAWSWLQRSRPVLVEVSRRLDGGPPGPGFVEDLQERFTRDPFIRDVLISVIADVAFNGRIPRSRPPGASWDRGLTWWAATLAGTTPDAFETNTPPVVQSRLFGLEEPPPRRRAAAPAPARRGGGERAMVISALRELLGAEQDGAIPAAAVRAVLEQLQRR
jgi:hypothetical protein